MTRRIGGRFATSVPKLVMFQKQSLSHIECSLVKDTRYIPSAFQLLHVANVTAGSFYVSWL